MLSRSINKIIIVVLASLPICSVSNAQDRSVQPSTLFSWIGEREALGELEPIDTDRPNFTEAATTVGLGVAQVETGYTYFKNGDAQAHSWGEPLMRYGALYNWFELRVGLVPVTEHSGHSSFSYPGANDFYFGSKLALTKQQGVLPQTAIIGQCIVPAGFGTVPGNSMLPGINYLYAWDLTDEIRLSGSSQLDEAADSETSQYLEVAQSANLKINLTEKLSTFTEAFALMPHGATENKPEYYFDSGVQLQLTKDVQTDMKIGSGLNGEADDLFVGGGLSVRFH